MAIFNEKDEITPTYIFFHFLRVSSRFFASGKVQTISSTLWSLRFILFLFSSTFFLLPFGFPVPVLSSSFYFLPLSSYSHLVFRCWCRSALLLSSILFSFRHAAGTIFFYFVFIPPHYVLRYVFQFVSINDVFLSLI